MSAEVDIEPRSLFWVRAGAWLFRQRTWIPLPLALSLLLIPGRPTPTITALGVVVTMSAELLRLWAVRHIGTISRTRSERLGPVVQTGPYSLVRNPLYLANVCMWTGFALTAGILWMVPVCIAVLGFEYHAIVRWEEQLLEARRADGYVTYAARVRRWLPSLRTPAIQPVAQTYSWPDTLFSERGTLIAIAVGYGLLWLKSQIWV